MYPKLRFGHSIIKIKNNRFIIGSITQGISNTIHDPSGNFKNLNEILTEEYTIDEVVIKTSKILGLTPKNSRKIIESLITMGHIEDGFFLKSSTKSNRYSRSREFFSWIDTSGSSDPFRVQNILSSSKIVIVGLGGIGGSVAMNLASSGVSQIHIVDFDNVEESNLNRQILYTEKDLGLKKSTAAMKNLQKINSKILITSEDKKITSSDDLIKYFNEYDLVYRCADSPDDIPFWFSDASLKSGKPWIDASYNGPIINCCIYDPKVTGCYRCIRESNLRNMTRLGYEEAHTDKVPEINAAISPIVLISGSLAAYEGIRYLAKLKPQSLGKAIHQNMFDYSNSYTVEIPHECQHRATQE